MRPFLPLLLVALCTASLPACSPERGPHDPKALPYTLTPVRDLGAGAQTADLDGDGVDEVVRGNYTPGNRPAGVRAVVLQTHDGRVIEQANFEGEISPLHFLDLDGDGVLEILAPYVRHDSLFLGIMNAQGLKEGGFFLANGEPRQEPDGALPWDPEIEAFYVADVDADAEDELVTVVKIGFARYPRGVLVHELPDGEPLGQAIIGGQPEYSFLSDIDGGVAPGLVLSTFSPNNGAVAGGFDDAHSYVIAFDLNPVPEVRWSREMGGLWSGAYVTSADVDGDGHHNLLVCTTAVSSKPEEARFEIVELATGRTLRHRSFAEPLQWAQVIDLNRDAQPEIVAVRSPGEVWVFDATFDVIQRRWVADELRWLEILPDVDGDGVEEIAVGAAEGWLLLDPALRVKAKLPEHVTPRRDLGVMQRGIGVRPYLVARHEEEVWAMELVENRLWWAYRYGPLALWVLGIVAALGAVVGGRSLYRRTRLLERVYPAAVDAAGRGVLVLDAEGGVVLMNAALCDALGLGASDRVRGAHVDAVVSGAPDFAAFLRRALDSEPPRHHADEVALTNGGRPRAHVTADPVVMEPGRAPYWLVALQGGNGSAAHLDARMWALMAEEVTHTFKTPLNTILLTAQNLQTEYRKQAPAVSAELDPYTERIVERVNALRWKAQQFMKILNVDALDLVPSDLSGIVREMQEALVRDIPAGVTLVFDLEPALPSALLDRDQIQTALENLVTNAVRALADEGTITVSTRSVSDLRLAPTAYEPTDYVVLEVQDNGAGIAETARPRVFEPGFTTAEFGTGLGLALVWRVATHHGGFVEVESELGEGSIFTLYVPVADA